MNKYNFTITIICLLLFSLIVCSMTDLFYKNDETDNSIKISASLYDR